MTAKKQTKFRFARVANPKIGRRTGVDVTAGKTIRKLANGMEIFDDYWTDSEEEEDAVYTNKNGIKGNWLPVSASSTSPSEKTKSSKTVQTQLAKTILEKKKRNSPHRSSANPKDSRPSSRKRLSSDDIRSSPSKNAKSPPKSRPSLSKKTTNTQPKKSILMEALEEMSESRMTAGNKNHEPHIGELLDYSSSSEGQINFLENPANGTPGGVTGSRHSPKGKKIPQETKQQLSQSPSKNKRTNPSKDEHEPATSKVQRKSESLRAKRPNRTISKHREIEEQSENESDRADAIPPSPKRAATNRDVQGSPERNRVVEKHTSKTGSKGSRAESNKTNDAATLNGVAENEKQKTNSKSKVPVKKSSKKTATSSRKRDGRPSSSKKKSKSSSQAKGKTQSSPKKRTGKILRVKITSSLMDRKKRLGKLKNDESMHSQKKKDLTVHTLNKSNDVKISKPSCAEGIPQVKLIPLELLSKRGELPGFLDNEELLINDRGKPMKSSLIVKCNQEHSLKHSANSESRQNDLSRTDPYVKLVNLNLCKKKVSQKLILCTENPKRKTTKKNQNRSKHLKSKKDVLSLKFSMKRKCQPKRKDSSKCILTKIKSHLSPTKQPYVPLVDILCQSSSTRNLELENKVFDLSKCVVPVSTKMAKSKSVLMKNSKQNCKHMVKPSAPAKTGKLSAPAIMDTKPKGKKVKLSLKKSAKWNRKQSVNLDFKENSRMPVVVLENIFSRSSISPTLINRSKNRGTSILLQS